MSQSKEKRRTVSLGICGLGTVGSGVVDVLTRNKSLIENRADATIEIVHIGARRDNPNCDTSGFRVSRDVFDVVRDPAVDVVVELIGGTTVAKELVVEALRNGKSVVTANKALIATHGNEILALANEKQLSVCFEAAVAGGIPIIKSLSEGLASNCVNSIAGIINGTGNYILTEMRDNGSSFEEALAQAQALGYAEADPTFDVEGIDAAQKLVILSALAFGMPLNAEACFTEGISKLSIEDIRFSELLGYRIKHLGLAKRTAEGVEMRVHPTLVPESQLIANVSGVMNAVLVDGDAVGKTMYYGPGAGAEPTASAVIADIVDIAKENGGWTAKCFARSLENNLSVASIDTAETPWYLRIPVEDRPGVLSEITSALSAQDISVHAMQQPESAGDIAQIVLTTEKVKQSALSKSLEHITALDFVRGDVTTIRVETFE